MPALIGFSALERQAITTLLARCVDRGFALDELVRIEKADMPGFDGKVIPARAGAGERLSMVMYLSAVNDFTVVHELAHVHDIATRRQDSLANLDGAMPASWHLAYKMASEYYANRVACAFGSAAEAERAFRGDAAGLMKAARRADWGSFLVYYSLLLGILHGMGRMDLDPFALLRRPTAVPANVEHGMGGFRRHAGPFFDGHGAERPAA